MIYLKFLWSLLRHKWFVLQAGLKLHVPLWWLLIHDSSKFSRSEFGRYARNFQGDYSKSPVDQKRVSDEFTVAWLHHENRNDHHWGYWIPRSGKSANKTLPMPEMYIREMVADWHAASRAYTGSWNIAGWLSKSGPKMRLHWNTVQTITSVMIELGYVLTDNCTWSWAWIKGGDII